MLDADLAFYVALGFLAQLVDGAMGMAYGLIASSVFLASGVAPATATASIHAAEMVTTALAGASHIWHRNVDWRSLVGLTGAPETARMASTPSTSLTRSNLGVRRSSPTNR